MTNFHILTLLSLMAFLSCGDDLGGNNRGGDETNRPGIEVDDIRAPSHLHRTKGTNQITSSEEISGMLNRNLPNSFRPVPSMGLDDEGTNNVNVITISSLGRPTEICGVAEKFEGIEERMADCQSKNVNRANWNGALMGAAGESRWRLVSRNTDGKEIWLDTRTGLAWSDIYSPYNWCQASGNSESAQAGIDIDCQTERENTSVCGNIVGAGADISWRLPTRNDYLQADINGLRFVLNTGSSLGSWTATMVSGTIGRRQAWVYHFERGTLSAQELTTDRQVRCVGAPIL